MKPKPSSPWVISSQAIEAYLDVRGRGRSQAERDQAAAELREFASQLDGKEATELPSGSLQYRTGRPHGRLRLIVIEKGDQDGRPVLINVLGSNDGMRPGSPVRARGGRPRTQPEAPGLRESELRRRLAAKLDAAIATDGRSTRQIAEAAWGDPEYASTISKWRSGSAWPSNPAELEQLAAALRPALDPGDFFTKK